MMTKLKKIKFFSLCLMALPMVALADAPSKKQLSRYSALWTDSPFTTKPQIENKSEAIDALADWMLAGVSSVENGYFVTLMDKRDRSKRIRLAPGLSNNSGIELVSVNMGESYRDTKVKLRANGQVGELKFDTAALKAVSKSARGSSANRNRGSNNRAGRKPVNNQGRNANGNQALPLPIPGANNQNNNQNQQNTQRVRRPRPRIVPARKR